MGKQNIGFLIMNMDNCGGTERVTSLIANGLVEHGYIVSIISCQNGMKSYFELNNDIKLYSLKGEEEKNSLLRKLKCFWSLKSVIDKNDIDIMVAVDVALYIYLYLLQLIGKCKCIAWEHFGYYVNQSKLVKFARCLAVKCADCVVVLGQADLRNYTEHFSKIKRIEYIYNPLSIQVNKKASMSSKKIIAAGRLTGEKGFDMLIEIWSCLERKYEDWSVDIYGEGPLKAELQRKIELMGLKNIHLKGFSRELKDRMQEGSIFVLTSRYEGFGLVLIEAQAVGLPCVSFSCKDGPAEIIIDNENGFLVEPENISIFAEKLERLMKDEHLRKSFSSKSDLKLERYNIDNIMEKWISIIEEL